MPQPGHPSPRGDPWPSPRPVGLATSRRATVLQSAHRGVGFTIRSPYTCRNVLDYNHLRNGTRAIIDVGHVESQETLCQHILSMSLSQPGVSMARVRVAKLDAFSDCSEVGCEMERCNAEDAGRVMEDLEDHRDALGAVKR